jgi:hypothetical protein
MHAAGASFEEIQAVLGHAKAKTLLHYMRHNDPWEQTWQMPV